MQPNEQGNETKFRSFRRMTSPSGQGLLNQILTKGQLLLIGKQRLGESAMIGRDAYLIQ